MAKEYTHMVLVDDYRTVQVGYLSCIEELQLNITDILFRIENQDWLQSSDYNKM